MSSTTVQQLDDGLPEDGDHCRGLHFLTWGGIGCQDHKYVTEPLEVSDLWGGYVMGHPQHALYLGHHTGTLWPASHHKSPSNSDDLAKGSNLIPPPPSEACHKAFCTYFVDTPSQQRSLVSGPWVCKSFLSILLMPDPTLCSPRLSKHFNLFCSLQVFYKYI